MLKRMTMIVLSCLLSLINVTSFAAEKKDTSPASIEITELENFESYNPKVKQIIQQALILTKKNLTYTYASHNPKNGGMDCSGTIYYLLHSNQIEIPRGTDVMYEWIVKNGKFHSVREQDFASKEFDALEPGDLLFWTGTWEVKRSSPISHVMMYLGKDKFGNRLMFGASNGRTYKGRKIWGVSVFDFKLPAKNSKARFIGYSCIPTINCTDHNN